MVDPKGLFDEAANAGGAGDVSTQIKLGNQNLSAQFALLIAGLGTDVTSLIASMATQNAALIAAINAAFPQVSNITGGTFTCGAAATTTVTQVLTQANSFILLMPTNAAAGTLMGGVKSLYVSARTANTSFAVSTAAGTNAAGTEQFSYLMCTL